ncbi:hypothetical protein KJ975_12400 [Myxococcota bacterium]|nr:hypothetical protein [Myxococcota bacterium]
MTVVDVMDLCDPGHVKPGFERKKSQKSDGKRAKFGYKKDRRVRFLLLFTFSAYDSGSPVNM